MINSVGPVKQAVTTKDAASTTIATGNILVPKASVSPTYDEAGNLANDGRWVHEWDSENCRRKMTATAALSTPQTHLWGRDIAGRNSGDAGQLQGAGGVGGVGGLLAVDVRKISDATSLGKLYASYDSNGNIRAWSGADGAIKRSQDYDALGNVVLKNTSAAGPLAANQGEVAYGFSTKPEEKESRLLYHGYRYYDPVSGRWPSRDPIGERGGVNLYGFVRNNAATSFDVLGRVGAGAFTSSLSPPPQNPTTGISIDANLGCDGDGERETKVLDVDDISNDILLLDNIIHYANKGLNGEAAAFGSAITAIWSDPCGKYELQRMAFVRAVDTGSSTRRIVGKNGFTSIQSKNILMPGEVLRKLNKVKFY